MQQVVHCSPGSQVSLPQEAGLVLRVGGEALQRVCPKTGRNPRSGSPIIPLEIFLVDQSECNSAPRKKLTSDLQTACLTPNLRLITRADIFHHIQHNSSYLSDIRTAGSVTLFNNWGTLHFHQPRIWPQFCCGIFWGRRTIVAAHWIQNKIFKQK